MAVDPPKPFSEGPLMDALAEFQAELDTLAELDDAALAELETRIVAAFDAADAAQDDAGAQALADALDQVRAEKESRGETEESAPEPAPAEASATPPVQEGTPVAASAVVPEGHEPIVASASRNVVVAGGDIPGVNVGAQFSDLPQFGKALAARINQIRGVQRTTAAGDGEKVIVASIQSSVDKDRLLIPGDLEGNTQKIEAITNLDAITAAGGLCAPLTTRYDLFDCGGVTDRPVKAALAGFQADRGGIRFFPGPSLGDVVGGVGFWTSTNDADALDAEGPTKACVRIECPGEVTAEIQAVTMCIVFGVLQNRVFPELAVANTRLLSVAQARLAESSLLAQIKAGSAAITETAKLSATRDLLDSISRTIIYFRDRYRLGDGRTPLRAIFPWFVKEIMRGDIAMGEPFGGNLRNTFAMSDADIEGFFKDRGVNVTWALDSAVPATNSGGFYAASAAAIPAWPTTLQWALYPEGSWLYLDGGQLDLGIIRDSALVKKNDYMQFSEVFEAATNIGCESWWITSDIALTGMYQGPRVDPAFQSATAANA